MRNSLCTVPFRAIDDSIFVLGLRFHSRTCRRTYLAIFGSRRFLPNHPDIDKLIDQVKPERSPQRDCNCRNQPATKVEYPFAKNGPAPVCQNVFFVFAVMESLIADRQQIQICLKIFASLLVLLIGAICAVAATVLPRECIQLIPRWGRRPQRSSHPQ